MRAADSLLSFARDIADAPDAAAPTIIAEYLSVSIGADDVFHIVGNASIGFFHAWRASKATTDPEIEAAMPAFDLHPGVRSYIDVPDDLTPRRMSEVPQVRDPQLADALHLSQPLLGHDQLSILQSVAVDESWSGDGWVLGRGTSDFTDTAVDVATHIAPILMIAHRLHFTTIVPKSEAAWAELTEREQQTSSPPHRDDGHRHRRLDGDLSPHREQAPRECVPEASRA